MPAQCGSLLAPAQTSAMACRAPTTAPGQPSSASRRLRRVRGPGPCCWPSSSRAARVSGGVGQAGGRPLRARKLREGGTGAAAHLTRQRVLTPGWPPCAGHCPVPGPAAGHVVTRASETLPSERRTCWSDRQSHLWPSRVSGWPSSTHCPQAGLQALAVLLDG